MTEHDPQAVSSPRDRSLALAELIAEYKSLDPATQPVRCKELLFLAAPLVDREADAIKWARIRFLYAQLCKNDDPHSAIAAYSDALTVFRVDGEHDLWLECHGELGLLHKQTYKPGTDGLEQAIVHLECAIADQPSFNPAEFAKYYYNLATLYYWRVLGDPDANWRNRIKYLELAAGQISSEEQPDEFARLQNAIGIAYAEQPGVDAEREILAMEQRIKRHEIALAALHEKHSTWIQTCLYLGAAYLDRVKGAPEENASMADSYLLPAREACIQQKDREREPQVLLLLGRILIFKQAKRTRKSLNKAVSLFKRARLLVDSERNPELLANIDKFFVIACLELIRLGRVDRLEPLIASCEAALLNLDEQSFSDERRKVLQIETDALVECGEFARARATLERAIAVTAIMIAQATTTAGRIDRIWKLRDSAALLSYCCLRVEDVEAAVDALERGKALVWNRSERASQKTALFDLIPESGALLMPLFTAPSGAVIVATRESNSAKLNVVWLADFGKRRLSELLRGESDAELGGWLRAYCDYRDYGDRDPQSKDRDRDPEPQEWRRTIDDVSKMLYDEVWSSVLPKLEALGVKAGAELVWLPQGGSGVLPMHAAWRIDNGERRWLVEEFALRYAPSLVGLAPADSVRHAGDVSAFIVANPTKDLAFTAIETARVRESFRKTKVLRGDQASKQAILAGLEGCAHAHFAAHARFDLDDPFQSCIRLAGKETLTLTEWFPSLREHCPSFVVLSACDTAVARVTSTPDEFIGFPAALLAHGVRTVLATLWSVDDDATALLMGEFYREYANGANSAAEALRRAQNWLRALTVAEIIKSLSRFLAEPAPAGSLADDINVIEDRLDELLRDAPSLRPFAEPYYWAAFTVSGR